MTEPSRPNSIISVFAKHNVAANLLMALMLISGVWALTQMNTQFFPQYDLNYVNIRVIQDGASAEDVEEAITIPLEQELRTLDRLKEMKSSSQLGIANITLEFQENTDMGVALDNVKEKVGLVRNLPQDSEEPEIIKIEDYEPVARMLVTGGENLAELRAWARRFERELLAVGIDKIDFEGLPQEEIAIEVDVEKLEELNLSLDQIASKVAAFSDDVPIGTMGKDETAKQLRFVSQARTFLDFSAIPIVSNSQGGLIRLGDVADIEQRPVATESRVYFKGKPAVDMSLQRVGETDSLEAADKLNQWVEKTRPTLPPNMAIYVYEENWQLIMERINLLLKNGAGGLLLILIILFLFLNGRVALWVAIGIPTSFMATLAILHLTGESINMISLFGIIMALGIIVDDAIVVGEDALAHYQSGESASRAAEGGAKRMFAPVLSSSLTTIAAFLPLMLVGGIIGDILFSLPLVVISVIIASLIESFLVLPGHLDHSFRKIMHREEGPIRQKLDQAFSRFRDEIFRPFVTVAIKNRMSTLALAVVCLALGVGLIRGGHIQFVFFPSPEGKTLFANAEFASGTPPDEIEKFIKHVETAAWQANDELVTDDQAIVKTPVTRMNATVSYDPEGPKRGEQYASLYVELTSPDSRDVDNETFIAKWRELVEMPQALENLTITASQAGPPGKDLDIQISGADSPVLKKISAKLIERLRRYDGVDNVTDDMPYGQQQMILDLTATGKALGFTIQEVGRQIQSAFNGRLVQIYNEDEEELEVRVMLPEEERNRLTTLHRLNLFSPEGISVPLDNVVKFRVTRGIDILRHTDGLLTAHVTATVDNRLNNANKIIADISKDLVPELKSQYGVNMIFVGKAKEQRETLGDMTLGLIYAMVLIYIILAWVFASYSWPLAVMAVIPFGLIGAIFGHWLMGIDLTLLSLFGLFGLSGIVINDSIVLVTFYKKQRQQGMAVQEAIIEASSQRLRAVLLTSLTTIAGLVPLLFETSLQAQFLIPMACSISFGLAFGTFMVLLLVPCLLSITESVFNKAHAHQ